MAANPARKSSLSLGKMILIGSLGVVFLGVILFQYVLPAMTGPAPAQPSASGERRRPRSARKQAAAPAEAMQQPIPESRPWPEFVLANVVAHDPFALPHSLRPPRREDAEPDGQVEDPPEPRITEADRQRQFEQRRDELLKRGIQSLARTDGRAVVRIGDKDYEVGQVVNGLLVVEIQPDGVVFAESNANEESP